MTTPTIPPSGKQAAFALFLTLLSQSPENVAMFAIGYGLDDFVKDIPAFSAESGVPEADLNEIAAAAAQGQDVHAPRRGRQHVITQAVLRRFRNADGMVGSYSLQFGPRKPTGPGGLGWSQDFVKIDSTAIEELWGRSESKFPEAIDAAEAQTLFDNPDLVATLKEAIALHYARSLDVLEHFESLWTATLVAKRSELESNPALTDRIYRMKTGNATGTPDGATRAELVTEWLARITAMFESGTSFRFRVSHYFREATNLIGGAGLEILTPPMGSEFLIGDVPVITTDASGRARGLAAGVPIGSAKVVALPLSPTLLVSLGPINRYTEIDKRWVERLNEWQIEAAKSSVFFRPSSPAEPLPAKVRPPAGPMPQGGSGPHINS